METLPVLCQEVLVDKDISQETGEPSTGAVLPSKLRGHLASPVRLFLVPILSSYPQFLTSVPNLSSYPQFLTSVPILSSYPQFLTSVPILSSYPQFLSSVPNLSS
ncbi:hypothetical protein BgiBS90_036114 [Biomphalaria glabrata]|nr:hypothetical protein BgiBS90_036114 [Biomphalaria glabrata]